VRQWEEIQKVLPCHSAGWIGHQGAGFAGRVRISLIQQSVAIPTSLVAACLS
jgi:hypothetical protein